MKPMHLPLALGLTLLAGVCPAAPLLDPGGFSVDFRGAGATRVSGAEMLVNGGMETLSATGLPASWQTDSYVWLPVDNPPAQARMLARLKPLLQWQSSTAGPLRGRRSVRLAAPQSAFLPADPAGHEFCAMFHQAVPLTPLSAAATYVLSYHYRGWSAAKVPNSRPYVRVTFYDHEDPARGQQTRLYAQSIFASQQTWRRGELVFTAPAATRCLDVRLALTGPGEVWFDELSLRRALVQEAGPAVRLMPAAYLDNRYCLSSGDAGTMCFGFRDESGSEIRQPQLWLRLPPGIGILDTAPAVPLLARREVQADGLAQAEYGFDLTALKSRIHDGTFAYPFNQWDGLQVLVRTRRPAAPTRLPASYWLQDGAYRSEPLRFDLQIVPPLPTVRGPKTLRSGAHLFLVTGLTKPEAVAAFGKLYSQVGLNCVHVPACPVGQELGRLGIERYGQPFANGYTIGDLQKPAEATFHLADGTLLPEAICPTEVYLQGAYYRDKIANGLLRDVLVTDRTAEQLMCNWEPFMYVGRGCFCDRCQQEFAGYSKLPRAEVDRCWPRTVIQEHGELWARFRSWQHARMMATLEQTVQALGQEAGHETHFIPELYYGLLTPTWDQDGGSREYAAVDYLDKLPVLNAWAPYNWYVFGSGPYDYIRGRHLNVHVTASEVQRFVAGRLPSEKRARLFAFPFGTFEGATQPEALVFEMQTYLLDGYEGVLAYLFPGGYDARYWRALAEMNRQLALVEPFLLGKSSRAGGAPPAATHTLSVRTPLPSPDPRYLENCAPLADPTRWRKISLLNSWEFSKGEARLIAVGNFWEQGECFYRLSVRGLRSGRKYVLRAPATGRCYTNARGAAALAVADLASGLLLHTGAMRYSYFVIEPYQAAAGYGSPITPAQMAQALRARLR
jgi:hypothetical protein